MMILLLDLMLTQMNLLKFKQQRMPLSATDGDGNSFDDASKSESNIVDDNNNTDLTQKNFDGKLLNFLSHTDPRISTELRQIMENVAREYGRTLTITSAYRSPDP